MTRVYLDANVVIFYVERNALFFPQLKARLLDPAKRVDVVFSDLVRMETRLHPMRMGAHDLLAQYDHFFQALQVQPVPMSGSVFDPRSAPGRRSAKPPASCHL